MRTKTKPVIASLTFACLAWSGVRLQAQPVPVQQFDQNQLNRQQEGIPGSLTYTNAPELYPGENEDVGPQRILKFYPNRNWVEVVLDTQLAFTDNNRLTHTDETSTAMAINTLQLGLAPTAYDVGPGQLTPQAGFRSQWYNYFKGSEQSLDFNAQTFFVAGHYLLNQKWQFDGELDYTRLLAQQNYSQFYTEFSPTLDVQRLFTLRDNMLFSVSLTEEYHVTSVPSVFGSRTDVNDRLDSTLGVTLTYEVSPKLVLQPYYRFEHTYYLDTAFNTDRSDFFQTVGASVSYYFTRQLSARIYAGGTFRTSDDPHTTSYESFNTGIGASLVCRF
jgi:hypothetical protein